MGLDQMWIIKSDDIESGYRYNKSVKEHRKIPALEEFMEREWREASGDQNTMFNGTPLAITPDILDRLQQAINDKTLDEDASGCFWGKHEDYHYTEVREAIRLVRLLMASGLEMEYMSSW